MIDRDFNGNPIPGQIETDVAPLCSSGTPDCPRCPIRDTCPCRGVVTALMEVYRACDGMEGQLRDARFDLKAYSERWYRLKYGMQAARKVVER